MAALSSGSETARLPPLCDCANGGPVSTQSPAIAWEGGEREARRAAAQALKGGPAQGVPESRAA